MLSNIAKKLLNDMPEETSTPETKTYLALAESTPRARYDYIMRLAPELIRMIVSHMSTSDQL